MSTHWDGPGFPDGSRAQPPVRDTPRFEWVALVVLVVDVVAAVRVGSVHLHGHDAGLTSGLFLGIGLAAALTCLVSAVQVARSRREVR